ncbi:MAG: hydroxymethylglutaryl-CoA reductase [Pseudomonadota bacterium]
MTDKIPRNKENDYTRKMVGERSKFIKEKTGVELNHITSFSFEPSMVPGNIENLIGAAQVPMGLAGPLLVHGEYARGEFFVPLATSEGTLVASYNRGMRIMHESGGITTTVSDDAMQRAPVFMFKDARYSRDFGKWIDENFEEIRKQAESTTKIGKLLKIEQFHVGKIMYLRFHFSTGDAAGQNMVGKATFFACKWIVQNNNTIERFLLSGNIDTDKKHSALNTLSSRGKRVTAEAVIPRSLFIETLRVTPEKAVNMRLVSTIGSFIAGANNNGLHSANGITALFIATGQDVANVAESSAAINYAEVTENGDYYYMIVIPSLIVATHGGGTGLATQQESLNILDCNGAGKAKKLAEIVAATVISGEISLAAAAISGEEWVSSHDTYGRNR